MVPTAVVGAAALFAYSNGCAEAVVVVARASYGAYATLPQTVFGFGIVATVGALAEARAVALAALVAVFSGLWPYVKLSYLLVHWLRIATLPSALVGHPPRLLRAMEAFGKWSLVDFFVMAVAMAVFAVHQVLLVGRGWAAPPNFITAPSMCPLTRAGAAGRAGQPRCRGGQRAAARRLLRVPRGHTAFAPPQPRALCR